MLWLLFARAGTSELVMIAAALAEMVVVVIVVTTPSSGNFWDGTRERSASPGLGLEVLKSFTKIVNSGTIIRWRCVTVRYRAVLPLEQVISSPIRLPRTDNITHHYWVSRSFWQNQSNKAKQANRNAGTPSSPWWHTASCRGALLKAMNLQKKLEQQWWTFTTLPQC